MLSTNLKETISHGAVHKHLSVQALSQRSSDIRLVILLPAADTSAEIHCQLIYTSLNKGFTYESLSYAWGDPTVTDLIFLEGQKFAITKNLRSALKHLRFANEPRTLWVGSMCIDQLNIEEGNFQVQQMRQIYENAPRTLVWFGEGDSGKAIAFLKKIDRIGFDSSDDDLLPERHDALEKFRSQPGAEFREWVKEALSSEDTRAEYV